MVFSAPNTMASAKNHEKKVFLKPKNLSLFLPRKYDPEWQKNKKVVAVLCSILLLLDKQMLELDPFFWLDLFWSMKKKVMCESKIELLKRICAVFVKWIINNLYDDGDDSKWLTTKNNHKVPERTKIRLCCTNGSVNGSRRDHDILLWFANWLTD